MAPVATFVQVYILYHLGGTALDIGLVSTLSNAVAVPAAIVWGSATERFRKRKLMIVLSYSISAATLIVFLFASTISAAAILYAVITFASTGATTPLNLLIMETEHKQKWPSAFAKLSTVASLGTTIGLVFGSAWAALLPLLEIVLPLSIFAFASAVMSALMIHEPSFVFERQIMAMNRRSFFQRLLAFPLFFLKIPTRTDFQRMFRGIRHGVTQQVPLLYISIFVFYIASGLFNTSLTPSLYSAKATQAQNFLVSLDGIVIQTIALYLAGPYIERRTLRTSAISGLIVRGSCYVLVGVSSLLLTGVLYLGAVLILWPIASGIAFAVYYTASNVMIFNTLGQRNQASTLGVYSALVGIALTVGSFISGLTSFYIGYYLTFVLAGVCLGVSAGLTSFVRLEHKSVSH